MYWARVGDLPLPQTRAGALGSPQNQPGGDVFDCQRRLLPQTHGNRHFFRIALAPRRQILLLPAQALVTWGQTNLGSNYSLDLSVKGSRSLSSIDAASH
jgi:hypothetical protein